MPEATLNTVTEPLTSRQRIRRALQGRPVDRIPLYENFIALDNARRLVRDVITEEHRAILSSAAPARRKNARHRRLLRLGLERELDVAREAGIDAFSVAIHPEVRWIASDRLETEFGRIYTPNLNLLGYGDVDELQQDPTGGWVDSTVHSVEELVERKLTPRRNHRLRVLEDFVDHGVLVVPELLMLQRVWSIFGYLEWIDVMHRRTGLFDRILETWLAYNLEAVEILADAGYRVFFYGDDLGSSRGGLYPMEPFRNRIVPYLTEIAEAVHDRDGELILHSCGDIRGYLPDLVRAGIDGLHPLEPPMLDFATMKREWGDRICLVGNVDSRTTLVDGTPEEVREETRRLIELGGLKRHILSPSHSIHPGVPFENWMAMLDAAREYGTPEWVEAHPPEERDEEGREPRSAAAFCPSCHLAPPSLELPTDWDEALELRRRGEIGPVDLFLVARATRPESPRSARRMAIGTVATPHETGRTIVAACLRAEGHTVTDVETVTTENFREKLEGFEVVFLSLVKNPQAVDQAEVIGRALKEDRPSVSLIVGGSALTRLVMELMEAGRTEEEARETLRDRLSADGLGLDEVEAVELTRLLIP